MGAAVKTIAIGVALIGVAFIPGVGAIAAGILKSVLIGVGSSVSLGGVAQALRKPQSGSKLNDPRGRTVTIRQPAAPRTIIYGAHRIGGVMTFTHQHGGTRGK